MVYEQTSDKLKYVCIDVANGYPERFATFVKQFREYYPNIVIIAGNVVTGEMTEELLLSGADIVKVSRDWSPGSVCTTRIPNRRWLSPTVLQLFNVQTFLVLEDMLLLTVGCISRRCSKSI